MTTVSLDHKAKATIIHGPRGSGKSILSQMIANRSKGIKELCAGYVSAHVVEGNQFFRSSRFTVFPIDAKVVIVRNVDVTIDTLHQIKLITESLHFEVERKGCNPVKIATPYFIYEIDYDKNNLFSNYFSHNEIKDVQVIGLS